MLVQPCLFFDGRCEEARDFHRQALDAEVTMLMRYKDNPGKLRLQAASPFRKGKRDEHPSRSPYGAVPQ